ncbi:MAG TPA: hypothetical protein VG222_18705 [Vicinamibacterales bacterium]|nr:hypothetical protein [Vicinamibacterales bacterium]
MAALHRGDRAEARRLIQAAIDGGAPTDEALAVLDRLDRLQLVPVPPLIERARDDRRRMALPRAAAGASRTAWGLVVVAAMLLAAVAVGAVTPAIRNGSAWRSLTGLAHAPAVAPAGLATSEAVLPLPRRGETALSRARALAASGHLHDALTALDAVRATDPQKGDADRLRAELQHQLLGLPAGPGEKADRPLP